MEFVEFKLEFEEFIGLKLRFDEELLLVELD